MLVLLASAAVRQLRHELAARAVRRERARADAELGRRREVLLDEVLLAYARLASTPPRALANATEAELIGVKECVTTMSTGRFSSSNMVQLVLAG